jgi:N6-L-threonylcarbamoyladenine synthase
MKILGIESSCDETAASVVENGNNMLSNVIATSMHEHAKYGGIVPEIAARSHVESIIPVIDEALKQANEDWSSIDGIAVTYGAGLGGSLLVGVETAKNLAITKKLPLFAINHVEGHVYANFITKTRLENYSLPSEQPEFPLLALIVSGGHSQLVFFKNHFDYKLLGQTSDDAVGEAFDKVAKLLGLPYPGGPNIEKAALRGDPNKYKLPKAKLENKYDFSFSGLKTAVLRLAQHEAGKSFDFPSFELSGLLSEAQKADIAASFLRTSVETLVDKTVMAENEYNPRTVLVAGGVAANSELRKQLNQRLQTKLQYPDIKLCTDNGVMIATLGCFKMMHNQSPVDPYKLQINPNLSM